MKREDIDIEKQGPRRYVIYVRHSGAPFRESVGRIDRSPMNPKVWCLDIPGKTTGMGTGHCGAAAAKKEAMRILTGGN